MNRQQNDEQVYFPPITCTAADARPGKYFLHRLQVYYKPHHDECGDHPCAGMEGILAYHHPGPRAQRVPVRFTPDTVVYPARFDHGKPAIMHGRPIPCARP